uniref:sex-determining region Y protein-like n=1 Tax=Scatophagus argus TaxID=75038 RepID=UPI001ED81439|nr:sex-determining region Y protein-like [Scatophagus argus]
MNKKRKRQNQQEGGQYIKKPPNAFMLFLNEQRPHVEAEIRSRGNAAVNTVLGQKWKSLSQEQQATYYEQADRERRLHAQQHPEWSSSHNYGKKRKRERRRKPTCAEDETQQAKKVCVTPVQTAVTEALVPQTDVFEPHAHAGAFEPHAYAGVFEPHVHTDVFEPHRHTDVFEPHVHTDVFEPHRHTDVFEPHRHTDVFEPHRHTDVFEPHRHTDVFEPHRHTDVLEPSIQYVTLSLPPDWMFQQQLPVHSPPPTHTQTYISQSQTSYPANDGAARAPSNHCTASAAHGQTQYT